MDSQPSQSGRFSVDLNNSPRNRRPKSSLSKSTSDASTQSLSAILNNPHGGSDATWTGWWSSSTAVATPEFAAINTSKPGSEIAKSDFQSYVSSISDQYNRFHDIQTHTTRESVDYDQTVGQGEALVACLREVPALYFKEDFKLEDGATFRAACPFSTVNENFMLQEKLSQYLDVVELHLVKEISLRSNSFFEAQEQLEGLNVRIVEGCSRIRELKETIRLLDSDLVDSARQIQELNETRSNMLVLQQKLRLILNVNQALSALKLLVTSGDCAGALDITDDLQQLLDGDELTGLHCFRHLGDHVNGAIDSINSILSAEFMRTSIQDTRDTDATILAKSKARATLLSNGKDDDVKVDEDDTSNIRDQLLPLIVGLLRTAKLPTVLRLYRDTLTAEMKSAIKMVVAELLPVLVSRPSDSDFTQAERVVDSDGGGSSLASKLRTLSSDNFVQLLQTIFRIVWAHLVRAAEVKKAIEWIMCNLDGHYAADSVAAAIAAGAVTADASQETDVQISSFLPNSLQKNTAKAPLQGRGNDATSPSNISRNFRADVLRENTEAVFAACDAAHGRWAKLLGVRAVLHPKLRLQEFLSIYNITQEFITATEKMGGRLGYSIRGTLQSQAKAFVDFQHESRMAKIKAVLDQETWAEVDVPDEFQAITASLYFEEPIDGGGLDDTSNGIAKGENDPVSSKTGSLIMADGQLTNSVQPIERTNSTEVSADDTARVKVSSSTGPANTRTDTVTGSAPNSNANKKDRMLSFRGVGYHMVNCGLILLKMLSEYIDMNDSLSALSSEVVHRVVELLKFFNTRSCQLVLGAGAMQVSGLKSITSKHLALASQVISFTYAIIPEIRRVLFSKVPETRKHLLLAEIDRVAQDYKVHRDEIHTKLVQIMRERLLFHLRGLPQIVEGWNRTEDTDSQPSNFARSVTKEVGYLQRVLSRTLHEVDVQAIFRRVVLIFHTLISEAYSRLEISTPQAKNRLYCDIQHILGCIRSLPSDDLNKSETPNWGQLDEFLVQRFGTEDSQ